MKINPTNAVAIDVDGTLFFRGRLNQQLADWIKKCRKEGVHVTLWSARGLAHAKKAAEVSGLTFDAVIPKPGYIVDDKGWKWIKQTRVLRGKDGFQ